MADENDVEEMTTEDVARLDAKCDFIPGIPDDLSELPETRYQVLMGKVYVLTRWPNGSSARGILELDEFIAMVDKTRTIQVQEGWYDELFKYLGNDAGFRDG